MRNRIAVCAALMMSVAGCMTTRVDTETPRVAQFDARFSGAPTIFIAPVVDERPIDRIGVLKNGYNQVLRDVDASDPIDEWFADSAVESFRAAGARVVLLKPDERAPTGSVVVELRVRELFVEGFPGVWTLDIAGKAVCEVVLTNHDGAKFARRFGGFVKKTYFAAPRDVYEQHIHSAVDELFDRLVEGVFLLVVEGRVD